MRKAKQNKLPLFKQDRSRMNAVFAVTNEKPNTRNDSDLRHQIRLTEETIAKKFNKYRKSRGMEKISVGYAARQFRQPGWNDGLMQEFLDEKFGTTTSSKPSTSIASKIEIIEEQLASIKKEL